MHFRKKSSQYQSFIWRTWKILILNLKSLGLERYFSTLKVRVTVQDRVLPCTQDATVKENL